MQKQTPDKPLFADLLWSRPENRRYAGKLLIIGGHSHSLAAPAKAFQAAEKAGIGTARVALPGSTRKVLGNSFPEAEFLPSTPSGSFSAQALGEVMDLAEWADGLLLAGDFGRNSETAVLIEKLAGKYKENLVFADDSIDYFIRDGSVLLKRAGSISVITFSQLQKLAKNNFPKIPLLHSMDIMKFAEVLNNWTNSNNVGFLTEHQEQIVVSFNGRASITPSARTGWQAVLPAYISTWTIQQPSKTFEALTTAVYDFQTG